MSKILQHRRGNTAYVSANTPADGELLINTDTYTILVGDGSTVGGIGIAKQSFAQASFDKANTVNTYASAGFDLANTNSGSITVIQAVDLAQNTSISAANNKAQAAFDSGNTNLVYAQASYAKANADGVLAQASFDAGNTTSVYAQASYAKANADGVLAQASFDAGNTTSVYAQSAYAQANTNASAITVLQAVNTTQNTNTTTAQTLAQAAFNSGNTTLTYAQSAYAQANTSASAITVLQAVDTTQNTNITNVNTKAQAAFDAANSKISSINVSNDNSSSQYSVLFATSTGAVTTINYSSGAGFYITPSTGTFQSNNISATYNVTATRSLNVGYAYLTDGVIGVYNSSSSTPSITAYGANGNIITTGTVTTSGVIAGSFNLLPYSNTIFAQANAAFNQANTDYTTISTTSGIYGGSAAIPVITLAANGRVSAITNTSITTGTTITNETASSSTYYPMLTTATSGSISVANTSSTKMSFVPSTGTLTVTDLNTTSDAQYKENVQPIGNPMDILNTINGVSFNWKDSGNKSYGVIAQELQKVLPELVKQGDQGLTVSYIPLIAILIEAIKEQQKQIDELKK